MEKEIIKELERIDKFANHYIESIEDIRKRVKVLSEKNYSNGSYMSELERLTKDMKAYIEYMVRLSEKIDTLSRMTNKDELLDRISEVESKINKCIY